MQASQSRHDVRRKRDRIHLGRMFIYCSCNHMSSASLGPRMRAIDAMESTFFFLQDRRQEREGEGEGERERLRDREIERLRKREIERLLKRCDQLGSLNSKE